MSQSPATVPLGLPAGPPVSPPAKEGAELRAAHAPAPVPDPPRPLRPPPETHLVEAGKLSMGQLAQAHRDRLETGKQVLDIIVERGWVSAEEVAELRAAHGIEAPPPCPEPVHSAPEPEAPPAAEPTPATSKRYRIAIRLTTGELITAGETDGPDKAAALGHAVVADLTGEGSDWPFFAGRYINPETIVSVDLLPADAEI